MNSIKNRKLPKIDLTTSQRTLRYYRFSYVIALLAIALITIVSQILVQDHLNNQQHDSHLINYASRLRTNSQSLMKLALLIESERDVLIMRKDFKKTLMQWENTHESLINGNDFLSLPANKNEDMRELFNIINEPYEALMVLGNEILDIIYDEQPMDKVLLADKITEMLKYEKSYFLGIEMIVFDYDRNSRTNILTLKKIEGLLLILVLCMLILEAMFIFRPLSKRIATTFDKLIDAQDKAVGFAADLKKVNLLNERNHREVKDINFALEKATFLVKTDAQGNIIYANDKYCFLVNYKMSELLSKPLFYDSKTGKSSVIYEHINNEARNREIWQGEIKDHTSDGAFFWLDVTLMPIMGAGQVPYQYLMIGANISERKRTAQKLQLLMEEKIKRQEEMAKILSASMLAGQDKERKRVAAEIHDGIGQMLTSLRMRIEMLSEVDNNDVAYISDIQEMMRSVITETRRIIAELLPSILEDFGLEPAINDLVGKIQKDHALQVVLNVDLLNSRMHRNTELGIYRILQEAMNNIIKHANATQVKIALEEDAEFIVLEVSDNGKGFTFNKQDAYDAHLENNSHGLSNMNERANSMGAELLIETGQGNGTLLRLEIPTA